MMPSFLLRCPNCGRLRLRRQFDIVEDGVVECPRCGHRFHATDDPRLN